MLRNLNNNDFGAKISENIRKLKSDVNDNQSTIIQVFIKIKYYNL